MRADSLADVDFAKHLKDHGIDVNVEIKSKDDPAVYVVTKIEKGIVHVTKKKQMRAKNWKPQRS